MKPVFKEVAEALKPRSRNDPTTTHDPKKQDPIDWKGMQKQIKLTEKST